VHQRRPETLPQRRSHQDPQRQILQQEAIPTPPIDHTKPPSAVPPQNHSRPRLQQPIQNHKPPDAATHNMKDLSIYKIQHISDASFDTPISLSISLAQKEHINATLNAQIVFTRDGELQQIPVYGLDDQIQTIYTWIIRETSQQLDLYL